VGTVLGDHRLHLGKLDDLTGGEPGVGTGVEVGAATTALGGAVVDHLVRRRRHLRAGAGAALLLSRPSALGALGLLAAFALLGLALPLGGGIP